MRFRIKGVEYDSSNIVDAPLDLLFELNRLSGLEGQDVVDGLKESERRCSRAVCPACRGLMATAALVWLGKAIAGERGRLRGVRRRSVAVRHRADPGRRGVHCSRRGDAGPPTQPGSVPAIVVEPVPQVSSHRLA